MKLLLFKILLLLNFAYGFMNKISPFEGESVHMTMMEQVKYHGYPVA